MPTTALYRSLKIIGSPLLTGLYHHEVTGLENLPKGPFIVASNHLAFCDSIFIPLALPRTVNFLAKSDYFTTPGLKGRAMATFFRGVGQLPMDRSARNPSTPARGFSPRAASSAFIPRERVAPTAAATVPRWAWPAWPSSHGCPSFPSGRLAPT